MFSNHLHMAWRHLMKHRGMAFINILGLALGLAGCILIMLLVQFQLSVNTFHENLDDLYLLTSFTQFGSRESNGYQTCPALAPALKEEYPEVLRAARVRTGLTAALSYEDQLFSERFAFADPDFLLMFTFPLVTGDPETALDQTHSILLTESMAQKYFGDANPMGQIMTLNYEYPLEVTGVLADFPTNSTMEYDFILPMQFSPLFYDRPNQLDTWYNLSFTGYIQLAPGTDHVAFNEKVEGRIKRSYRESNTTTYVFPYRDYYLYSMTGSGGRIVGVYVVSIIAAIILLIACINFMNLATARAAGRAAEIGIRKVVGARRRELIAQFYSEAFLQTLMALLLAFLFAEEALPHFNRFTNERLTLDYLGNPLLLPGSLGIAVITALIAGSYPALILSSFKPVRVISGMLASGAKNTGLRRTLVVLQFSFAVLFIFGTVVAHDQMQLLRAIDTGYKPDGIAYFRMHNDLIPKYEAFRNELLKHPDIDHVTKATNTPIGMYTNGSGWSWEGKDENVNPLVTYLGVSKDYLETMGLELVDGHYFRGEATGYQHNEFIINQTFAEMLGEGSAVGKRLSHGGYGGGAVPDFTVIGVVQDFTFKGVGETKEPIIFDYEAPHRKSWFLFAHINAPDMTAATDHIKQTHDAFLPDRLIEFRYLEQELEDIFARIEAGEGFYRICAALALIISCLGLYGLASYVTTQRSHEIGIRKVLGASLGDVLVLLTREFLLWVLVANLITLPIAYLILQRLLSETAYQIEIGMGRFAIVAVSTLVIAGLTVSYRAMRTALTDPVEAIRYE